MPALAPRYAEALLQALGDPKLVAETGKLLRDISDLLKNTPELSFFMFNPVVPAAGKKEVLSRLVPDGSPALALNFLKLLIDKRRLSSLDAMIEEFERISAKQNGVLIVNVMSANELDAEQLEQIAGTYKRKYNAQDVSVKTKIVPSLIGGVKIQIGDMLTDDSLSGRLRGLKAAISQIKQ